jgi:hypothetical protein
MTGVSALAGYLFRRPLSLGASRASPPLRPRRRTGHHVDEFRVFATPTDVDPYTTFYMPVTVWSDGSPAVSAGAGAGPPVLSRRLDLHTSRHRDQLHDKSYCGQRLDGRRKQRPLLTAVTTAGFCIRSGVAAGRSLTV